LDLCNKHNIPVEYNDKAIAKISDKENCFIAGVFNKYKSTFKDNKQIVLVNPSNSGNLGTIMRTMLGFGIKDLAIVKPCVDYFDPTTARASMGAVFGLNIVEFNSVEEYLKSNTYKKFFFMLNGKEKLGKFSKPTENYALVFGNEAHGLPNELLDVDVSVVIEHSKEIDSLNLPISVGMAIYEFRGKNGN
ncbi:MAG: TrmH family RNA methyltransferase, partial [Clostridia bacterium]|nr:TrmH family RNA methyltransferase [Clostridia bacterium]